MENAFTQDVLQFFVCVVFFSKPFQIFRSQRYSTSCGPFNCFESSVTIESFVDETLVCLTKN